MAVQVLVRLGADLNRVLRQVILLLHGYQGQDAGSEGSRLGERVRAVLPDDALAWFDAVDRRLTALERWVSMQPDLEGLDQDRTGKAAGDLARARHRAGRRCIGAQAIDVRCGAIRKTAAHCSGSAEA